MSKAFKWFAAGWLVSRSLAPKKQEPQEQIILETEAENGAESHDTPYIWLFLVCFLAAFALLGSGHKVAGAVFGILAVVFFVAHIVKSWDKISH